MRLDDLVRASNAVASTSARTAKIARLSDLLRSAAPEEIEIVSSFLAGSPRQGRIGLGYAAIQAAADTPAATSASLSVLDVDQAFEAIAAATGAGSARVRAEQLRALFARTTHDERVFLQKLLYGELRQGALEGVVVEAIAKAAGVTAAQMRRAVQVAGELPAAAKAAFSGGGAALDALAVQLMRPIRPMLADSADDVAGALEALPQVSLEYKLDGARVQIHKANDEVRVFSRTSNDVTASAPDIVEVVRALPARELILDGEAIALDAASAPRPFQETMRRFGRRRDVERLRESLPLSLFAFDCLYLDGQILIDEPLGTRADLLHRVAPDVAVPRVVAPGLEEAQAFARTAIERGHEGVMAKALDSTYAAGRRGSTWLKIKTARTLDLVVLAAEWGHGRRQGRLSNLHLGARDPRTIGFVMLGKTFKGMTDDLLAWQTEELLAREIGRDGITVFVRPELVVEVAFNEIQRSAQYPGGLTLRFARIKRYRADKTSADANSIDDVRRLAGDL